MKTLLRILLPFLILGGGIFLARAVAQLAPEAERKPVEEIEPLVEMHPLKAQRKLAVIKANGLVTAAQQIDVMPQVTGEVVYVAPALVPGGFVKKGETLIRIDPKDYRLAVEQQQGSLRSSELQVEVEAAQQKLAQHEWNVLGEDGSPTPLFSRESQLAAAEASLESGKRGLDRAKLSLSRTIVRAPFDATVVSKNVDRGQVVGPQSQLAQLMGTDEMWVMVSVVVDDLALIQIPGINAEEGSPARVEQRLNNGKSIVRVGHVTRLVNRLDERTRRAQVVVSVHDALSTAGGLPMLAGAHVRVSIEGQPFDAVYTIPREAIYEGNTVWVDPGNAKMEPRQLEIAWGDDENVYAIAGPKPGDALILTRLSAPIPGMKVKRVTTGPSKTAKGSTPKAPDTDAEASTDKPKQEVN